MLKILELFGGIGACSKALERIGIDYEIVDYVEIDKYAVKSFNAMHNTNFEPQDITTWDKDIEVDLIMHGSPCQDFSVAGKGAGGDKDSGTRSSLMYETIRIVGKLRPKYVIWENVKNLLSKKHKHNFDAYLETMEKLGYTNYYQVLNAKDYGIPQNRERVFTVSILGNNDYKFPTKKELKNIPLDYIDNDVSEEYILTEKNKKNYQRDFGSKGKELNLYEPIPTLTASMGSGGGNIPYFQFPPKQELKQKLKDLLEDEVDEKYYLSDKAIQGRLNTNFQQYKLNENIINNKEIHPTILARYEGSPTLYKEEQVGLYDYTSSEKFANGKRDYGYKEVFSCLKTSGAKHGIYTSNQDKIRKLTPKECWRLMGFDDSDFEKASKVNSNTQLYKQAGNSIVVNVLEAIFKELFKDK